ncbi:MAG TPA: hypothetical protein VIX12_03880 [Candidatus Binataceae bacterium]
MAQSRLRSSFIYLANAVIDLRGNWATLAVLLGPLALVAALCLLPDALNLQYRVAQTFEPPGGQTISFNSVRPAQTPYAPERNVPPGRQPFSPWVTTTLHVIFFLLTLAVKLVVLCALARMQTGVREPGLVHEAIAVYARAIRPAPAFALVVVLQLLATAVGFVLLIVPGVLVYVWLYFAPYSLIFDDHHSWPALIFSRDLERGRFFKVATRIVVFLAVWTGYNSWAGGIFIIVSLLLGPVAVLTGSLWFVIFLVDLLGVSVSYATAAFFHTAGARLYQDLNQLAREPAVARVEVAMQATGPLSQASL